MQIDNQVVVHLHLIKGVGAHTIKQIASVMARGDVCWSDLYQYHVSDITRLGVSAKKAELIVAGLRNAAMLHKELEHLERSGCHLVTIIDDQYPAVLKEIHVPPAVLYYRGVLPSTLQKSVAIVGSRKANQYGSDQVKALVPPLVHDGWCVVSGGALGIDSMAHQATIAADGVTVVVFGSGLLRPYPHSNRALFDKIVATGGALVSSFPLTMGPEPGNFPARNRVIAGLSQATVVVQAAQKSGASITAAYALEQGKEVCAVPGDVRDPLSAGCHALIKQGAGLVATIEDFYEIMGYALPKTFPKAACQQEEQDNDTPEGIIKQMCSVPASVDELLKKTALSFTQLNALLCSMQLDGIIEQTSGGKWARVRR